MFWIGKLGRWLALPTEVLVDKPGLETEGFRLGTCVLVSTEAMSPTVH